MSSDELKTILEELPTINGIEVSFGSGFSTFCDPAGGNVVQITFTAVPGDVAELQVDDNTLVDTLGAGTVGSGQVLIASDGASLQGIESRAGTTSVDVCNNHGICDHFTGQCRCFPGWTSSDGTHAYGTTGDCGHRAPTRTSLRRHKFYED